MHYFIYPTKDAWISSGSNTATTGISERDQNYGQDPVLEIKKNFFNSSFDYQTRTLVQFNLSEISSSMVNGVTNGRTKDIVNPKFFLRLYETEGTEELSTEYKLTSFPVSESWDEGTGKFGDNPKVTNGVSWENRNNYPGSSETTWSYDRGGESSRGLSSYGGSFISSSVNRASQSFSYESPDINMDVTDIVNNWLNETNNNYGFLLRFSQSQETDDQTFGQLKFFSSNTHTIYPPKLEVRWDDHVIVTGSATGSLSELNVAGTEDNYLYVKQLRDRYKETEKVKFRVGARKRYLQKSFSTSAYTVSQSFVPEKSGSYSIVDVATGETIVPFKDNKTNVYTYLSCDVSGSYFTQWLNTFQPNRVYKILLKLTTNDNQEYIYDDDFEFKVVK